MPRVFIETTIPSFYFESRAERRMREWHAQTRHWWDRHRARHELITSPLVLAEFGRSPAAKSREADRFFEDVRIVSPPPGFEAVVRHYIEHKLMPSDAAGDAAHLAIASMSDADFLLTWNCRHLANANKQRHIRVINERLRLCVPTITTPYELIPE